MSPDSPVLIALMWMSLGIACGEPEVAEAPKTIEEQLAEVAEELKETQCSMKELEKEEEIDHVKRDELIAQLKKLNKKGNDLLNKNRLSGPEIDRLIKKYLAPAVDTLDC